MLTKADYQRAIRDSIASYPTIAPLYQAGDPRIMQHLDAMATMLAMFSAQVEAAHAEAFEKTRDATVLADAAMRGIVRKGKSARVRVRAINTSSSAFTVESGRTLLDSSGLLWRVETPAAVPAGGEATFEASQVRSSTVTHTVSGTEPFYAIEVPAPEDDSYLCAIAVSDADGAFEYRDRYVNTAPDERVFHVEADDRQRTYVRFGFDGVVGVQPKDGAEITLTVFYTSGEVSPAYDSPFSFEYLGSPAESAIELRMDALLIAGQNPMPMSVLRDLARYPSVYDNNAVFLGEFDFLVRRNSATAALPRQWMAGSFSRWAMSWGGRTQPACSCQQATVSADKPLACSCAGVAGRLQSRPGPSLQANPVVPSTRCSSVPHALQSVPRVSAGSCASVFSVVRTPARDRREIRLSSCETLGANTPAGRPDAPAAGRSARSSTWTCQPRCARLAATAAPASPAPTTRQRAGAATVASGSTGWPARGSQRGA